jgi:phage terminase large subunit
MRAIELPFRFTPREYQLPVFEAMDDGCKRAVLCWHRRAGKEKTCFNLMVKKTFERVGTYYYFFPTYNQGRKVLWDGMDKEGFPFLSHVPADLVESSNGQQMQKRLINDSIIQVVGTDNINLILGTNPVGCVFSEYALQDPRAWDFIRPILRENGGWAVFDFTPRGKNHGWDLFQMAKDNDDWFVSHLTVDDTGVLTPADIDAERREGMDEELIQQEYYVSFEGSRQGAYYAQQMRLAESEGRITSVPYEPVAGVETWWDLGIGDAMAIWFTQSVGREVRVIDYLEASGEGLAYYAGELSKKPYVYAVKNAHHAPADIRVRELGTGRSRLETARSFGIDFGVVPQLSVDDGIQAVRSFLAKCWFDKTKCARGLDALWSYHKDFDERAKIYRSIPAHDWSSHGADAFRYLSVGHKSASLADPTELQKTEFIQMRGREEAATDWMAS